MAYPCFRDGRVREVMLVQYLDAGLVTAHLLQLVIGAGKGEAGIEHLNDHIDLADRLGHLFLRLPHMSRIPSNRHCMKFPFLKPMRDELKPMRDEIEPLR